MREIRVNRLPTLTYRYLKKEFNFPETYKGACEETIKTALEGHTYTIKIPENVKTKLIIEINTSEELKDFYKGMLKFLRSLCKKVNINGKNYYIDKNSDGY